MEEYEHSEYQKEACKGQSASEAARFKMCLDAPSTSLWEPYFLIYFHMQHNRLFYKSKSKLG